jgi:hypothetical protein
MLVKDLFIRVSLLKMLKNLPDLDRKRVHNSSSRQVGRKYKGIDVESTQLAK